MSLLWLPVELQVLTLRELPFRNLLHCRALCKHFRSLIDSSKELLFIRELGAAGVKDNGNCPDSTKKKLGTLWQTNIAWANLHWTYRRQIQLSGTGKLFEIADGLFFHTPESTVTNRANWTVIEWFKLPSRRESNPEHTPRRVTFTAALVDFAVDAAHDLIVGIELTSFRAKKYYTISCNMYPKMVSTNETHPSAAQRVSSFRFVSPNPDFDPHVEICGNHIGVLLTRPIGTTNPDSFDMFILFDWTTGVTKANMGSYGMSECWETFCFLSTDSVLIPSAHNNLLNIYYFDNNPESLNHAVSLLLPEPLNRDGLRHIYLRSQPFSSVSENASHPAVDNPPFTPDPDEAVVVLHLDYRYHEHGVPDPVDLGHNLTQVVAVPRRVLFHYMRLAREDDSQLMSLIECSHGRMYPANLSSTKESQVTCEQTCIHEKIYAHVRNDARNKRIPHLHSEQWIHNTRWGLDSATPSMGCFAYGSRYLGMSSRVDLPNAPASSIALYDFSIRNERRGYAHLLEQDNVRPYPASDEEFTEDEDWDYDEKTGKRRWPVLPSQIVTTPSTVSVPQVFTRSFTTTLPYRVTETEMVLPWDSAIIDGERIIGLEFMDYEAGSIEALDVIVM